MNVDWSAYMALTEIITESHGSPKWCSLVLINWLQRGVHPLFPCSEIHYQPVQFEKVPIKIKTCLCEAKIKLVSSRMLSECISSSNPF